jgi:hypothetical protein
MKLTDSVARQILPPDSGAGALAERVEKTEWRLAGTEHAPVAISTPDGAPFDQKVVEAMVAAVDARIHAYDGQLERRIRDAEARMAVELQSLDRRHRALAGGGAGHRRSAR